MHCIPEDNVSPAILVKAYTVAREAIEAAVGNGSPTRANDLVSLFCDVTDQDWGPKAEFMRRNLKIGLKRNHEGDILVVGYISFKNSLILSFSPDSTTFRKGELEKLFTGIVLGFIQARELHEFVQNETNQIVYTLAGAS